LNAEKIMSAALVSSTINLITTKTILEDPSKFKENEDGSLYL
jgi:hypothetical protein